jgi:colanic acid/amylovoran biosynthesis protein
MNILLIGQCTLHWGRMEFGNIGNYYILEPLVREIHKTFPNSNIKTTFQLSDRFCREENISCLPIELYYDFEKDRIDEYLSELSSAYIYNKTGKLPFKTLFIDECLKSDLIIDFSGDMWGDNANFLGKDRFLIGLIKDRVAQLLNKKTVMIAGSPGPFDSQDTLNFAKKVYSNFDLVTNRESISINLLKEKGFDVSKTHSLSCPAFLFEKKNSDNVNTLIKNIKKPIAGFILCGWNFKKGPFDLENREESEYLEFAKSIEYISEELGYHVVILSHSNGFPLPPKKFKLQHGRDYKTSLDLYNVVKNRGICKNFSLINEVLDAWNTKSLIGNFDILISGRIHGAVAGLSQSIPTVIIDYGHEPKAHKLKGFSIEMDVENFVADPSLESDIINKTYNLHINYKTVKEKLKKQIETVKNKARQNFKKIK